jgi:hypothetical protein
LAAWKEGRTGFPYIDAIMTQLKEKTSHITTAGFVNILGYDQIAGVLYFNNGYIIFFL